ncbi:MAG: iron-sulfur cluster assembly protein [Rhodomicrobiaceae bacterium]
MTAAPHNDKIIAALKAVAGPDEESDIVSLGLVSEVVLQDGKAIFSIAVRSSRGGCDEDLSVPVRRN